MSRSMSWSKDKYLQQDLITRDIHLKYQSSSTHCSKVNSKVKVFLIMGQTPRSSSQGKKIMVPLERSFHKKYSGEISKL